MSITAPLDMALRQLTATDLPPERVLAALQLLRKMLSNIISQPMNEKFRKISRSSNALTTKVLSLPGGEACLLSLGFVPIQDDYVMYPRPETWDLVNGCHALIDKFTKRLEAWEASSNTVPSSSTATTSSKLDGETSPVKQTIDMETPPVTALPDTDFVQQMLLSVAMATAASQSSQTTASTNETDSNQKAEASEEKVTEKDDCT